MTALRKRLIEDMQLRNFSPHTIEAYVRAVAYFAKRFGRSPDQLTGEQVRQHLLWLVRERRAPGNILYRRSRHTVAAPLLCANPPDSRIFHRDTGASMALTIGKPAANLPKIPISIAVSIG